MSYGRACAFLTLAAVLVVPAGAQSVISTHSGLVHFFEGAVFLGGRPLESHLGRFPSVPEGAELRTADGRAEVLLTPGVFLRLGDNSSIRMVSNDLADTKVELETGSAIIDAGDPNPGTSVTMICAGRSIHLLEKGDYRIDSAPALLQVNQGEAEVSSSASAQPVRVQQGTNLPLDGALTPEVASSGSGAPTDGLSNWAKGRGQSISADNAILSQIDEDPDSRTGNVDGFTNFPFLGVLPPVGAGPSSVYSSLAPYQPGFNSIYLPGYTYAPLIVGLMQPGLIYPGTVYPGMIRPLGPGLIRPITPGLAGQTGIRSIVPTPLPRSGVFPGSGAGVVSVPRAPVAVRPATVPAPRVGVRAVGHR
jgi:hypothetical protein